MNLHRGINRKSRLVQPLPLNPDPRHLPVIGVGVVCTNGGNAGEPSTSKYISGTANFSAVGWAPAGYQRLEMNMRAYSQDKRSWVDFTVTSQATVSGFEVSPSPASSTNWTVLLEGPRLNSLDPSSIRQAFDGQVVSLSATAIVLGTGLSWGSLHVGDYSHAFSIDRASGFDAGYTGFEGIGRVGDDFDYGFAFP